jgi:hypothetical protein
MLTRENDKRMVEPVFFANNTCPMLSISRPKRQSKPLLKRMRCAECAVNVQAARFRPQPLGFRSCQLMSSLILRAVPLKKIKKWSFRKNHVLLNDAEHRIGQAAGRYFIERSGGPIKLVKLILLSNYLRLIPD